MKRSRFLFSALLLAIASILFYSEYGKDNFVDTFLVNPTHSVDTITIWKMNNGLDNTNIATLTKDDPLYDEVIKTLNNWQVRRTLIKSAKTADSYYKVSFNKNHSLTPTDILLTEDNMIAANGKNYTIVKGNINELLDIQTTRPQ